MEWRLLLQSWAARKKVNRWVGLVSSRIGEVEGKLVYYPVWDGPTRWFHWINLVCVIGLAGVGTAILYKEQLGLSDNGKILLITIHVWFGYVFAANLTWRIVWAFIGNRYARWSAILPFQTGYQAALKTYVRELIRGDVRPYRGHNPIARGLISILLILLILEAISGLVLAGRDIYYPPFGNWIAALIAAPGVDPSTIAPYDETGVDPASLRNVGYFLRPFWIIHYWSFWMILIVISFHITGVVLTELREGGGIVSAMFTGNKVFDQEPQDDEERRKT
jgi:Ni/Fe-hydrogenase 1 B-type cytochrome subunit